MASVRTKTRLALFGYRTLVTSCRMYSESGVERLDELVAEPRPAILTFWHSRMLGCIRTLEIHMQSKGHPIHVLISRSRDGKVIADILADHGVTAARGSSSRGGANATRSLVRYLQETNGIAVTTPDGPRGPSRRLQLGTIKAAQLSGAPILPMSFAASRAWRLSSWDRFIAPRPFSRLATAVGEPIHVPRELDDETRESKRLEVETAIRQLDKQTAAIFDVSV